MNFFLSQAFLWALPLAAAPLLLHLFDRRRNVTIEWGAMEFLMEAATRKTSARRLQQWLLLLLRILAVAALVLAMARPRLPGNWLGATDRSELILVLDNSMSTLRDADGADLFDVLLERGRAELAKLNSGDTVRIMAASPYPVWATAGSLRVGAGSPELIVSQLESVRPTNGASDLLAALFTAVQADADPATKRRRVVLLTDGQAADWKTDDEKGWRRFHDVLKSARLATELEVVELGSGAADTANVSVSEIRSSRTVVGVDQPFTITARIRNHSPITARSCNVSWQVDGEDTEQQQLAEIKGGASGDAAWHHAFTKPGVYAVSCVTDAVDTLSADNRATVVVQVVNEVPVLLVESAPGRAEMQQDAYFVQAAMGYVDGEAQRLRGVHQPHTVSPVGLERADLSDYRAVLIPNLKVLSEQAIVKLQQFVVNGGGLWIALGPRTDIEVFNQYFYANGIGLAPLALDGIVDEAATDSRRTTISPLQQDHPATAELADNERMDTSDVKIFRRIRFVPPPQKQDVSILLSLTNGEPFVVEKYVGRGRVIVQGAPLKMDRWSDLAKSQAFVVMVQDWLSYLTQPQATRHNLSPGDPIAVHLAETEHQDAVLRTPHGDEIGLTADVASNGVVFRSSRTILPGNYTLELGLSGERIPFHVRRDPRESDLTTLTKEQQQLLADTAGLSHNLLADGLTGANQPDPIWPLLLMALIGFMAAELLLAGLISRERFGSEVISETSGQLSERGGGMPMVFGSKSAQNSSVTEPVHDSFTRTNT